MIVNGKKTREVSGTLLYPLRVGERSVICTEGPYLWTTPVQAITAVGPDMICFETQNTNYRVLAPGTKQPISAVAEAIA